MEWPEAFSIPFLVKIQTLHLISNRSQIVERLTQSGGENTPTHVHTAISLLRSYLISPRRLARLLLEVSALPRQ